MAGTIQCGRRSRKDFGKIPSIVEIPNLIEVQKRSYEMFLQKDVPAEQREETGLQAVFKSVFPIEDYNGNARLEFDSYHFGDPKYTVEECHDRGMTFAIPLQVPLRLLDFDANDILHVRVDRRRKMLASAFLRAFSFLEELERLKSSADKSAANAPPILSDEEVLALFYAGEDVLAFEEGNAWVKPHAVAH